MSRRVKASWAGGASASPGWQRAASVQLESPLRGDHEVYVVMFVALSWVHPAYSLWFGTAFYPTLNSPTASVLLKLECGCPGRASR